MAGAALTVDLNARLANFQKGMDQANRALDKLEQNTRETNTALARMSRTASDAAKGLIAAFSVERLTELVRATAQWADELDNAATVSGLSATSLQALRIEAEKFGSSFSQTDTALQRFNRRLGQARAGEGELLKIFEQFNIALIDQNGIMRSTTDVLEDYAIVLANTADSADFARIAMAGLDSEGLRAAQAIAKTRGEFEAFNKELEEQGVIVNILAVQGLDRLNDVWETQLNRLTVLVKNSLGTIASEFFDLYDDISESPSLNFVLRAWELIRDKIVEAQEKAGELGEQNFKNMRASWEAFKRLFQDPSAEEPKKNIEEIGEAAEITSKKISKPTQVNILTNDALKRIDELNARLSTLGQAQGLETFGGQLDLGDVWEGIRRLTGLSGDVDAAAAQYAKLTQALEELAKTSEGAELARLQETSRQLQSIGQDVFDTREPGTGYVQALTQMRQSADETWDSIAQSAMRAMDASRTAWEETRRAIESAPIQAVVEADIVLDETLQEVATTTGYRP